MSNSQQISASMVLYKNNIDILSSALNSLKQANVIPVSVVDNSPTNALEELIKTFGFKYIHNPKNPGFGASHNLAFKQIMPKEYHLVVNPDVYFDAIELEKLVAYMVDNKNVGLCVPKVLDPKGDTQYLCKRYPSVFALFGRRFLPRFLHFMLKQPMDRYAMRDCSYDNPMEVTFASGCFMLFRSEVYRKINGFDESFFLYFEDADVSIRVAKAGWKVMYWPFALIFHHWARGSHNSLKLTFATIVSAFALFRRHGWKFW